MPLKGYKFPQESINQMRRVHRGKKHTQETKRKMSETHKRIGSGKWMKGRNLSIKTRREMSKAKKGICGENHPGWKGGISKIDKRIRVSYKYAEWRQRVFLRDDFICQECGKKGGILNAHHNKKSFKKLLAEVRENLPLFDPYDGAMIYFPLWDIDNGTTLCEQCHKEVRRAK